MRIRPPFLAGYIEYRGHHLHPVPAAKASRPAGVAPLAQPGQIAAFLAAGFKPVGAEAHLACRAFGA
jgi:hypothetical protein